MRDSFLHHAILEMDEHDNVVNASFNPYSMHRINPIPNPDLITDNTFFTRLVKM
jgi:inner membrane protein